MGDNIQHTPLIRLREIRLWHWRKVLDASCEIRYYELMQQQGNAWSGFGNAKLLHAKEVHALHIGFVQTLNDFFPVGDTAEKDAAK